MGDGGGASFWGKQQPQFTYPILVSVFIKDIVDKQVSLDGCNHDW